MNVSNDTFILPNTGMPTIFVEEMKKYPEIKIESNFDKFSNEDFYIAHDKQHVNDILSCEKDNGFKNKRIDLAESFRWTNSSFYEASKHALKTGEVSLSPVCGFHHAGWNYSGGFCTFNGLMISAMKLKNLVGKIGILDLDAHWGDGIHDIIKHFEIDYIKHICFRDICNFKNDVWKQRLIDIYLPKFLDAGIDILFYQAGADAHIDDPHGGYMTTEELQERDKLVFEFAKTNNIPLVLTLAGGYQTPYKKVTDIHINTIKEYLNTYTIEA